MEVFTTASRAWCTQEKHFNRPARRLKRRTKTNQDSLCLVVTVGDNQPLNTQID